MTFVVIPLLSLLGILCLVITHYAAIIRKGELKANDGTFNVYSLPPNVRLALGELDDANRARFYSGFGKKHNRILNWLAYNRDKKYVKQPLGLAPFLITTTEFSIYTGHQLHHLLSTANPTMLLGSTLLFFFIASAIISIVGTIRRDEQDKIVAHSVQSLPPNVQHIVDKMDNNSQQRYIHDYGLKEYRHNKWKLQTWTMHLVSPIDLSYIYNEIGRDHEKRTYWLTWLIIPCGLVTAYIGGLSGLATDLYTLIGVVVMPAAMWCFFGTSMTSRDRNARIASELFKDGTYTFVKSEV